MSKMWLYNPETKLLYRILEIKRDKLTTLELMSEESGMTFSEPVAVKDDGTFNFAALKRAGYDLVTEEKVKQLGLKIKED